MSLTRRSGGAPGRGEAPVSSAISRKVRPEGRLKNSDSLMPAGPRPRRAGALELRPAAEAELLDDVVFFFGQGDGVIEAERSERRVPDQTHADRRARLGGIGGARTVEGVAAVTAQGIRENRERKGLRPRVIPDVAGVGEGGELDAEILGDTGNRRLHLEGRAPEHGSPHVVAGVVSRAQV